MLKEPAAETHAAGQHRSAWYLWFLSYLKPDPKELVSAFVGALVGAIATQFAYPAFAPYVDLWAFQIFKSSPFSSKFLVIASLDEVKGNTPPGNLLSFYRLFCGGTSVCISKSIVDSPTLTVNNWRFPSKDEDIKTKTFLLSSADFPSSAVYIDQHSRLPGYLNLEELAGAPHSFAGLGYGCFRNVKGGGSKTSSYYAYLGDLERRVDAARKRSGDPTFLLDEDFRNIFNNHVSQKILASNEKKSQDC